MASQVQTDGWKVRNGDNGHQDLTESQGAEGNAFICLKFSAHSFSCSEASEFALQCSVTLLLRMFWKIAYQSKNSAAHKLIVSVVYVHRCLAWSCSNSGSLPENCNWSVQSHALSLTLMQLHCASFISPSLQQDSSLECSFCSVFLFVGQQILPSTSMKHHTWLGPPLCDLSDTPFAGRGDTQVPWFEPQLESQALQERHWRWSLNRQDEAPGCVFGWSEALSLWSRRTPASFDWTVWEEKSWSMSWCLLPA